jgi:hypothetical protein
MILRGLGIGAAFIGLGVAFAACSDDTGTTTDDAGTSPTGTATSTSTGTKPTPTGTGTNPVPDSSVPDSATPDSSTPTDGGGGDASDGAVAPTFTQVYALFSGGGRCGNACHLRNNGSGGLSMQNQAMAFTNLVGAANASNPTTCGGGTQRVVAGNAAMSKLFQKLSGNTCGNRMPQGGTAFNAAELATVQGWINAGAPNN